MEKHYHISSTCILTPGPPYRLKARNMGMVYGLGIKAWNMGTWY